MKTLAYINLVPAAEGEAFATELIAVSKRLQTDPNFLMQVFKSEAGLRPDIRNTHYPFMKNGKLDGYATGLLQFVPDTARALGTTTWELEKMTRVEQLEYVEKYFSILGLRGKLKSYFDVYLVVFFPIAIGKPDDWIFETRYINRTEVAKANPAIDINKDGKIAMAEFKKYLINSVDEQYRDGVYGVKRFF